MSSFALLRSGDYTGAWLSLFLRCLQPPWCLLRKMRKSLKRLKNCSQYGRANVTTTWLWPSLDFEMRRTDLICIATSTTFTSITRSSNYFTLFKDGFFLALVTTSWPIRQIVEYFSSPLFLKSRLVKVLALIVPSCNSNPTYFAHSWFFYTTTTLFCYSTEQPREKLNFARIGALGLTSIVAKVASKNKKAKKSRRRVDDTSYPTHLPRCSCFVLCS